MVRLVQCPYSVNHGVFYNPFTREPIKKSSTENINNFAGAGFKQPVALGCCKRVADLTGLINDIQNRSVFPHNYDCLDKFGLRIEDIEGPEPLHRNFHEKIMEFARSLVYGTANIHTALKVVIKFISTTVATSTYALLALGSRASTYFLISLGAGINALCSTCKNITSLTVNTDALETICKNFSSECFYEGVLNSAALGLFLTRNVATTPILFGTTLSVGATIAMTVTAFVAINLLGTGVKWCVS